MAPQNPNLPALKALAAKFAKLGYDNRDGIRDLVDETNSASPRDDAAIELAEKFAAASNAAAYKKLAEDTASRTV